MELESMSPELNELRKVILSSNLTTCYLILNELVSKPSSPLLYQEFRDEWIKHFKSTYEVVSKMKVRRKRD